MAIITRNLYQFFAFQDFLPGTFPQIYTEALSDSIVFSDILLYSPINYSLKDTVTFTESLDISGQVIVRSITDHILIHDRFFRTIDISLSQSILFYQPLPPLIDQLVFTQFAVGEASIPLSDTIVFFETLTVNNIKIVNLLHTLTFIDHGFGHLATGRPQDQIYIDPLPITHHINVTFTAQNGEVYTIFRPSFGNQYKTQYNHIQRESRGRSLILAGNDTYYSIPSIKSLSLTFEYMTQQDGQLFINFLNKNLGLPLTYVDHEGISYDVVITTPELELIQEDKNNYSMEFELEILNNLLVMNPHF